MKALIIYIGENYSDLFSIISMPIAVIIFLKERRKRFNKLVEEISLTIIKRMIIDKTLSYKTFQLVKDSFIQKKGIKSERIKNIEIIENLYMWFIETPFLAQKSKSKYFELIENIRNDAFENRRLRSFDLLFSNFLIIVTIIFSVIYIVAKENINIELRFIGYIFLGLLIVVVSLFVSLMVIGLFNRSYVEGKFAIKGKSYEYLRISKLEKIVLKNDKTDDFFVLFNDGAISSHFEKECVDTMEGTLPFEFLNHKRYQFLERLELLFKSSDGLYELKYCIKKESLTNGGQQFDVLYITMSKEKKLLIEFSKCINSDLEELQVNCKKYFNNYLVLENEEINGYRYKNAYTVLKDSYRIITDSNCEVLQFSDETGNWIVQTNFKSEKS